MEKGNVARPTEMNLSQVSPTDEPPPSWGLASIISVSFLVGAALNGHIFWLLCVKMKRTVNTIWFLHLTLSYLVSCSCLPFFVVQNVLNFRWVFGAFLCRAVNFCIAVGMLTPVFLLTIISLDRYMITCHPVWSRRNRTKPRARRVLAGVWALSVVMCIPYLVSYVIQGGKNKGFMEMTRVAFILENASTVRTNANHSLVAKRPMNLTIACFISLSFLVGTAVNGLFLWVLAVKMKRSVNTLWFLHLILTHLISSWNMPFNVAYILLGFHWAFGTVTCKLVNSLGSLGMFNTVFLLTIINLDRYFLTCHPIWSQHNRTISRAQRLVIGVWLVSFALSAPYLAFRETREVENGRLVCDNNYAFSNDWDGEKTKALRYRVHLAFFVTRLLLAFLVPFVIIMGCSYCIAQEMKKKQLVRRTKKPFRILVASVASFFISWLPYHLYRASLLLEGPEMVRNVLKPIFITGACFNFCFTPILYIFIGEKFQQVFKTSILALAQKAFLDEPITFAYNINLAEGMRKETVDRSSLVLTVT